MKRRAESRSGWARWVAALGALGIGIVAVHGRHAIGGEPAMGSKSEIPFSVGGCGGAYFLASPGKLVIDVEKRDRNRRATLSELRAILVGPDRRVIQEATIPDDGRPARSGMGPVQSVRLTATVKRKGVYSLNVTVSNDRYGNEIAWGFRTNCPHYLVGTSRGHRDAQHVEPIVLLQPGDVCFMPGSDAFAIDVSQLPAGVKELTVHDETGKLVRKLPVGANHKASAKFPADRKRGAGLWRLHVPAQQAVVEIDGVTRWRRQDPFRDLALWTPDPKSYFPLYEYRWLLTPYKRTLHGDSGERRQVVFQVHNHSLREKTIQLALEFADKPWPAKLSRERVTVKARQSAQVTLDCTVGARGKARVCHVRATPTDTPEYSTYSTVTVKAGPARAARPLKTPLKLKPYAHENEQFGHTPDFPVDWEMYFDLKNRPVTRTTAGVSVLRDGKWVERAFRTALKSRTPASTAAISRATKSNSKIAFDSDNGMYLIAYAGRMPVLMHSADGGRTFAAYGLGKRGGFDIEQFSGHNTPVGPPPILRSVQTARDKKRIWRRICDLELFLPTKKSGRIEIGEPILVSKMSLGVGSHSGVPSAVVSRGDKVHVIWAEATDPAKKVPGVPTFVATYDRKTRTLGKPVLVGYGAPPNDVHNRPAITMDSKGYLHALTGTHGRPFHYARSLEPNTANGGWTKAVPLGEKLNETYIGFVCGADDTLHLVCRLFRRDRRVHASGAYFATLSYHRKPAGKPWEAPRMLVVAPFTEYSIWYHRLTIDRAGRLFVSYDYWSTYWFYRTDHVGDRRTLMVSPDAGRTWKLAATSDMQ